MNLNIGSVSSGQTNIIIHKMNENKGNDLNVGIVDGSEEPEANVEINKPNNNLGDGVNDNDENIIRENDNEIDVGAEEGDVDNIKNNLDSSHTSNSVRDDKENDGSTNNESSDESVYDTQESGEEIDMGTVDGKYGDFDKFTVDAKGGMDIGITDGKEEPEIILDTNNKDKGPEISLDKGDSSESIENSDDKLSKNDGTDKEDGKEKGVKQVKTRYGLYITQIFGTFGPALGALSGPVGLLLIVYVLPKSTKMLLPMSSHGSEKIEFDKIDMKNDGIVNLNGDYGSGTSNNKILESLAYPIGGGPKKNTMCFGYEGLNKQDMVSIGAEASSEIMRNVKKAKDIFESEKMQNILKNNKKLSDAYKKLIGDTNKNPELLVNFLTELVKPENVNIIKGINKEFGDNGLGDQMKEVNKILQEQMQEVFKNEDLQKLIREQGGEKLQEFYNKIINGEDFDKFCEGLAGLNEMPNGENKEKINDKINELVTDKFKKIDGVEKLSEILEKFETPNSNATLKNPPSCFGARKVNEMEKSQLY